MGKKRKPTSEAYGELQRAYDYYNKELFGNELPGCLITFQRKGRSFGYYSPQRWKSGRATTDEIALNPEHYQDGRRKITELLSTLVHEMVHLKQHHFSEKPPTRGYHDKEFAWMMKEVGLYPSDTGAKGGEETGYGVSHYIIRGGRFEEATKKLLFSGFTLSWHDIGAGPIKAPKKKPTRQKYTCPECGLNAWSKYEAPLVCGGCRCG